MTAPPQEAFPIRAVRPTDRLTAASKRKRGRFLARRGDRDRENASPGSREHQPFLLRQNLQQETYRRMGEMAALGLFQSTTRRGGLGSGTDLGRILEHSRSPFSSRLHKPKSNVFRYLPLERPAKACQSPRGNRAAIMLPADRSYVLREAGT
jgi:hypothetical protein